MIIFRQKEFSFYTIDSIFNDYVRDTRSNS